MQSVADLKNKLLNMQATMTAIPADQRDATIAALIEEIEKNLINKQVDDLEACVIGLEANLVKVLDNEKFRCHLQRYQNPQPTSYLFEAPLISSLLTASNYRPSILTPNNTPDSSTRYNEMTHLAQSARKIRLSSR